MKCIDFKCSRVLWNHGSDKSHGSFKVEAVLRVFDANNNAEELFALGAGVLAGNVYALGQLVRQPTYLYQIAASNDRIVIFRTYTQANFLSWKSLLGKGRDGDTYSENKKIFESLIVDLKGENAKRIEIGEDIANHYLNCSEFSCLIKIPLPGDRRLELEFPVKHINLEPASKIFQVETGPILFVNPEYLSAEKPDLLKKLIPCFIHFNSFDRADFTFDFPYGVRKPSRRGKMMVEEMKCDIQLLVSDSISVLKNDK
jgi:hypothetical protein